MVNQLIIIGNGFDIHCGLKSKFSDYFDKNEPEDSIDKKFFNKSLLPGRIKNSYFFKQQSFWDVYFRLLSTAQIKDWNDVEKQITLFLTRGTESNDLLRLMSLNFLEKLINPYEPEYELSVIKRLITDIKENYSSISWPLISDTAEKLCIYMEFKTKKCNDELSNIRSKVGDYNMIHDDFHREDLINTYRCFLYNFLFKELQNFERNLKKYLCDMFTDVTAKSEVETTSGKILRKSSISSGWPIQIIERYVRNLKKCLKNISGNREYNLLSFNYTYPVDLVNDKIDVVDLEYGIKFEPNVKKISLSMCNCYTNIHGSLDKDIIIGIDEKGIDENDILYRFTKTYRLFELDNKESCLDKNIKHIKFYGHSLAAADYSYFQSIFDFYDIYNSDVDLTFYYSDFDGNQRHINVDRVVKLIKAYGNTLDNKDHGKNLLHKMRLENRLIIKELKESEK